MNVLFLAHRIPYPPDKGDKIRSCRELDYLSTCHRVWCACFVDEPNESPNVEALRARCEDVVAIRLKKPDSLLRGIRGLLCGRTVTESYYAHPRMHRTVAAWCSVIDFDAVLAFSSSMAPYALRAEAKRRILDLCDVDSEKWFDYAANVRRPLRWLYRMEGSRLAVREREWVNRFDSTLVISSAEAAAIGAPSVAEKIQVVTNGVELAETSDADGDASSTTGPTVGFVGVMNYRPNVDAVCWFVTSCWPKIRAAFPTAVFRIVGRSPTHPVRRLGRVAGVTVVGGVRDVLDEVRRFDISVAPMRMGRGVQNKVLEAMAVAKPVVLSGRAAAGIDVRDGVECVVADGPTDTIASVCRLLGDRSLRRRIGLAGRDFVGTHHAWEREMAKLERILSGDGEPAASREPCADPVGGTAVGSSQAMVGA